MDTRVRADAETNWNSRTPTTGWAQYGTGVSEQAHEDANIAAAKAGGIDAFSFLSIYPPEIYAAGPDAIPYLQAIAIPYQKYLSSSHHSDVKFMLVLQASSLRAPYSGFPASLPPVPPDTSGGSYLPQWGAYVASAMSDPQYLTINGKKILGLYEASRMPVSQWNSFLSALARTDVQTFAWDRATAAGATLGLQGMTEYPPNPGVVSGAGQHAYLSEWIPVDQGYSTPAGFLTTALVTANQDGRALTTTTTDANVSWVDQPTQIEWVNHILDMQGRKVSGFGPTFVDLHSWNEHFEGGFELEPTLQEGTRYLDGVKWARYPATAPSVYIYGLSPESKVFTRTGAGWAPTRMLASSCWSNLEMVDSTASDAISLSHAFQKGASIYGSKCSGCGSFTVQLDGSTVATVSTSNGTTLQHQQLYTVSGLTQATHTVQATIVGDGPVRLDEFEVTYNPRAAVPVSVPLPTTNVLRVMLWGQSNAVGQGSRLDTPTNNPFYPRYLDEHVGTANFWEPLGPVAQDITVTGGNIAAIGLLSPKRGTAPGIGAALLGGGKNPIMATIARSGTPISYWATGQPGQIAFDSYADEIISTAGSTGWSIVTLHGESDASAGTSTATYQAAFTAWIAHMRGKFPSARIYAVQLNTNCGCGSVANIRTAISNSVTADGNAELISGDSFGYGAPHYTDTGIDSLAAAIGARILANN